MKQLLPLILFILSLSATFAQGDLSSWDFKKEKDGVRVYTRDVANSNLKELRIIFNIESNISSVVAVISDIPAYTKWVYRCSTAETLKREGPLETYDYYQVDFPWPFSDRDMIMHSVISQHPETKVVISETLTKPGYLKTIDGLVRIQKHINKWTFTPFSENLVQADYFLNSEPAGNIPNWIVNMAIDQGPLHSMLRLRKLVQEAPYRNKQVAGILNYGEVSHSTK